MMKRVGLKLIQKLSKNIIVHFLNRVYTVPYSFILSAKHHCNLYLFDLTTYILNNPQFFKLQNIIMTRGKKINTQLEYVRFEQVP